MPPEIPPAEERNPQHPGRFSPLSPTKVPKWTSRIIHPRHSAARPAAGRTTDFRRRDAS